MSKNVGSMILLPIKICNFGLFGSSIACIFHRESNKSMHFDKFSEKIRNTIALILCVCVCCVLSIPINTDSSNASLGHNCPFTQSKFKCKPAESMASILSCNYIHSYSHIHIYFSQGFVI